MSMRLAKDLSPTYPACLIVDADEERAQRLARLLTLTDYRPLVVSTLSQALERSLREPFQPHALLLGQADLRRHPLFSSLVRRVDSKRGRRFLVCWYRHLSPKRFQLVLILRFTLPPMCSHNGASRSSPHWESLCLRTEPKSS